MLRSILIVGLGGFIGSALRFLVTRWFQVQTASQFPWGTFTVNIIGSFVIGLAFGLSEKGNLLTPEWRLFITVGLCGGFTTFSSLSNDTLLLLQGREFVAASLYIALSFFLGLLAVFAGRFVTTQIL
ncbi:MAG: fluoride efflux transporter CrcB [Bacteroidales bacterium]|nr:fluoride efflux transporter CrcB [Bacteroidales bacterium]